MDLYALSEEIEEMMDLAASAKLAQSEEEFKRIEADVMARSAAIRVKVRMWEAEKVNRSKRKSRKRGR